MSNTIAVTALAVGGIGGLAGFGGGPGIDKSVGVTDYGIYSTATTNCDLGQISLTFDQCKDALDKLPDVWDFGTDLVEEVRAANAARDEAAAAARKGYAVTFGLGGAGAGAGAAVYANNKKRKQLGA